MSAVFALPAAVRLPRTVAVRRALLAGLFLIGFVLLGIAFGTGAHAADRTPADGHPAAPALTGAQAPEGATATRHTGRLPESGAALAHQGRAADAGIARGTDTAAATVEGAVRPVERAAAPVTGRLTGPVGEVTGVVKEIGGIGETVGGALPVHLPVGTHPGRPGDGGTPAHGGTLGGAPAGPGAAPTGDGPAASHLFRPAHCTDAPQHLAVARHQHRPGALSQRDAGRHGLPGQGPQGPAAPPAHTAGDGHGPRGGDQHAAVPADSPRFRLLPGGVRTADGAPTRRRAEEILEFPG
ncbi:MULTISPECIES: hypothetical protein [unclassified Streptomyces]|uniref:hypothetical protein n=1 Tax=unclassified Streptomyces TaxID=2593676 RepID=UPI00131A2D98|nr:MULTISPECIES: hypothetical protein [unclassified Streptomyces]MYT33246.1 hypothetical protein [Streptomyces sp. SID8354]